jgi:hypothetical protein
MNWRQVGDIAHFLSIANTGLFAISVVKYSHLEIFDQLLWRPDGFCVSNKESPYLNSHSLCFYVDTLSAILMTWIYFILRNKPGMEKANDFFKYGGLSTFGHGLAHFAIGSAALDNNNVDKRELTLDNENGFELLAKAPLLVMVKGIFMMMFFWITLLKASTPKSSFKMIVPLALISAIFGLQVPPQFGFTFTQTVLLLTFSCGEIMRPREEKNFLEYGLYPIVVGLPLLIIAWLESTQCSNFMVKLGGHLVYDAFIAISMTLFYLICWKHNQVVLKQVKSS